MCRRRRRNKQRLVDVAPKAILASGKNRELIKAMDMAASLEPQAVYLLWTAKCGPAKKCGSR